MGIYSEYLDRGFNFDQLTSERKAQLRRISALRGRDVLAYAVDFSNQSKIQGGAQVSIEYSDLLPISDQISNLSGSAIDLILETPGGDGAIAEDIVKLIRGKYQNDFGVIVPGYAKSAGTIIAMSADEILMGPASGLGPIDAQLFWQGKVFSAEALLEGMRRIKDEVATSGSLNKAYIPILQNISPGELQSAQNALDFAKILVKEWLAKYKFKNWHTHSTSGKPVTDEDKRERAGQIADQLCSHAKWLTHSRSIKIEDLRAMKLVVTDFSTDLALADAIHRYHTLLQMTFATNIYKVIETPASQIYRFIGVAQSQVPMPLQSNAAVINFRCPRCGTEWRIQANLEAGAPLQPGAVMFPANNRMNCPNCGVDIDLAELRRAIESQAKKPIVS